MSTNDLINLFTILGFVVPVVLTVVLASRSEKITYSVVLVVPGLYVASTIFPLLICEMFQSVDPVNCAVTGLFFLAPFLSFIVAGILAIYHRRFSNNRTT